LTDAELLELLRATGEEIFDEDGNQIGYASQPARFKLENPRLARGGFLVVTREEETGAYVGTIFDALPHPKTGRPYPAGHSEEIWRTTSLQEALRLVRQELGTDEGARVR
jgi:hypothetical protein